VPSPPPCTARTSPSRPPTTLCPRSDSDDTSYLSERKHHTDETDDRPEVDPLDHREERTQPLAAHGAGQATFGASTFSSNSRSAQFRSNSTIHFGISEDTETCSVSSLSLNTDFRFNDHCCLSANVQKKEGGCRLDDTLDDGPGHECQTTQAAVVKEYETAKEGAVIGYETAKEVKRSPRTFFLKKIRNSDKQHSFPRTDPSARVDGYDLILPCSPPSRPSPPSQFLEHQQDDPADRQQDTVPP